MGRLDARILQYCPRIYRDRREPFPIRAVGCTVFDAPGPSQSFANLTLSPKDEGAAFVVEYAVYYDYDIQHLYDLEHVWVAVDARGAVCGCWSSFHGMRLCASGVEEFRLDGAHPVLYAQPGKHAMLPDPRLFGLHPELHRACGLLAGGGLLIPPMLRGQMHTDAARDARIRRYMREKFAFSPSFEFEEEPLPEEHFMSWPELLRRIPERVDEQLRAIERSEA